MQWTIDRTEPRLAEYQGVEIAYRLRSGRVWPRRRKVDDVLERKAAHSLTARAPGGDVSSLPQHRITRAPDRDDAYPRGGRDTDHNADEQAMTLRRRSWLADLFDA